MERERIFLSPYNSVKYKYGRPLTITEYIKDSKKKKRDQIYEHNERIF